MNDSTMQVRRYRFSERYENRMGSTTYEHMREDPNGMYVMADDLDTALAQVATLTREREADVEVYEARIANAFAGLESARREVEGLRAGLLKARTELAGVGPNSSKDFHGMGICSALRIIDASISTASGGKP